MKISIFGLGYVGAVSGACLADLGHDVVGVDISDKKVDLINQGEAPIVEEFIAELTVKAVKEGKFRATTDGVAAAQQSDISLVSVGTPTDKDGSPNLSYVYEVVRGIGAAIRGMDKQHTVVIRSTIPPGTTQNKLLPILEEAAGRKVGDNLNLVFNPEFLREGRSVRDFRNPPFTVIGSCHEAGFQHIAQMYESIPGEVINTDVGTAESIKILSNAWHGLKVSFTNEASRIFKSVGVDGRAVMDVFLKDTVLNVSPAYMRPGFAFGGSCLPKDLRAIVSMAAQNGISAPIMKAALDSNADHLEAAYETIKVHGRKPVLMFGLAFKPGTDDLRESPYVSMAEKLLGKGYQLKIYDPCVDASRLMGKNKEYIDGEIPHFVDLMVDDAAGALEEAEIILLGHADKDTQALIRAHVKGKTIIDLSGFSGFDSADAIYEAVGW